MQKYIVLFLMMIVPGHVSSANAHDVQLDPELVLLNAELVSALSDADFSGFAEKATCTQSATASDESGEDVRTRAEASVREGFEPFGRAISFHRHAGFQCGGTSAFVTTLFLMEKGYILFQITFLRKADGWAVNHVNLRGNNKFQKAMLRYKDGAIHAC